MLCGRRAPDPPASTSWLQRWQVWPVYPAVCCILHIHFYLKVCMCVCVCPHVCAGALGSQKGSLDPWSWSYRWLWATGFECWEPNLALCKNNEHPLLCCALSPGLTHNSLEFKAQTSFWVHFNQETLQCHRSAAPPPTYSHRVKSFQPAKSTDTEKMLKLILTQFLY